MTLALAACGSDGGGSAKAPAGAKENAAGAAVCYDWPNGTVAKDCARDLKGPGGGRVFYDAGSVQPWGRFLEVAPQSWNGTLYECPGELFGSSCGAADGVPKATGDFGPNGRGKPQNPGDGYPICGVDVADNTMIVETGGGMGDGLANTDIFYGDPDCNNGAPSAVKLTRDYRGGNLADWYLPSEAELVALCHYSGRNGIGGFPADEAYASSTAGYQNKSDASMFGTEKTQHEIWTTYSFKSCKKGTQGGRTGNVVLVRPIRAF